MKRPSRINLLRRVGLTITLISCFAAGAFLSEHMDTDESSGKTKPLDTKPLKHRMAMGIDVSHYQGFIEWDKVAKYKLNQKYKGAHNLEHTDRIEFAYAKATAGVDYVDPQFFHNWHGIRQAKLLRGAYHFFYASDDPVLQAKQYIKTVKKLRPNDLPPMLDVEILDGVSAMDLVPKIVEWLQHTETEFGKKPIIYSNIAFARKYLDNPKLSEYQLWVAEYSDEVGHLPDIWSMSSWLIWQYSESGKVDGISAAVDQNWGRMNISEEGTALGFKGDTKINNKHD